MHARVEVATQQLAFYLGADRLHLLDTFRPTQRAIPNFLPQGEQLLGRTHQVTAQATSRVAATVDQPLKISFQMRPAPLQPSERPIHPRTVAMDHPRISLSQPIRKNIGGARGPGGEQRE